ncbi:MAG: triosephosphate isomerase, partial [Desulfovibrio sp.]|nr:triosephosphate isomerase [Desulfovibrio sp.]
VMLCVGETLEEREAGDLRKVLTRQLTSALSGQSPEAATSVLAVAYEPVWAIGTGKTATPADIAEAHGLIRDVLRALFGSACEELPILYGGSVKPSNTAQILGVDNVNGVLVGGASLEAKSFLDIVFA